MRLMLLWLVACNPAPIDGMLGDPEHDGVTALVADDPLPPPMTLQVSNMVPGQVAVFTTSGAPAGQRVYFLFGPNTGTTCPPALAGACLGITRPTVLGSSIAGRNGVATLSITVPATVPTGTVAWFQAGTLPNPTSVLSDVVRRVAGGGSGPSSFLVADTATNRIYELDAAGVTLRSWASPVQNVRGVAWDHTGQDGFWVTGLGDIHTAYKLDLNGNAVTALTLAEPRQDVRGLDYWPSAGGDLLTMVSWNTNGIQVVYGYDVASGSLHLESSHYAGNFLTGFWGIAVTAQPSDVERWTTWNNGDVELWPGSQGGPVVEAALGGAGLRGVDTDSSGDLYVVDAARRIIHHLASDGSALGTITLTLQDPADISVVE